MSSASKKSNSPLSPKKKEALASKDQGILSPQKNSTSKKRRTVEATMILTEKSGEAESTLQVKLLSEFAVAPKRGSALAAGYDLSSAYDCVVPARGRVLVQSDIAIALPSGTYGRIAPRSGLAVKSGITTGAGVIDADYRGSVGVLLFNHSDEDVEVKRGDRVAQLIVEQICTPEVEVVEELSSTTRGDNGFGSTGVATDCTNTIEKE